MSAERKWLIFALAALVVASGAAAASYLFLGNRAPGTVQGYATVPTGEVVQPNGVLIVQDHVVHLMGWVAPREEPNCRTERGIVIHCTLLTAGKLAELVAGKTVQCGLRRFGKDDRNWGICKVAGAGSQLEDSINGQLLLAGWVLPNAAHGQAFAALGQKARDNKAGLWAGTVVPNFVRTGVLVGNTEINDGRTLEIQETRMTLFGIDAPDLGQMCTMNGLPYQCGLRAYVHLIDLFAGTGQVLCIVSKIEGDDRGYGRCGFPNNARSDIRPDVPTFNERMVRSGWAIADRRFTDAYVEAEDDARTNKRGLWAGEFVKPAEWRDGKR